MAAYERGQTVKLTVAFTDAAGAAADPGSVTCTVESADGSETTYTYGVDAALTKTATGSYQCLVDGDESGMWSYRWVGVTGTATAVVTGRFGVLGSVFA